MQLSILDELYEIELESIRGIKAKELLCLLNDGLKEKDKYYSQFYFQHKNLFVLIACNKNKDILFNAIDENGNTPYNFSVNWKTWTIIKDELNL